MLGVPMQMLADQVYILFLCMSSAGNGLLTEPTKRPKIPTQRRRGKCRCVSASLLDYATTYRRVSVSAVGQPQPTPTRVPLSIFKAVSMVSVCLLQRAASIHCDSSTIANTSATKRHQHWYRGRTEPEDLQSRYSRSASVIRNVQPYPGRTGVTLEGGL